MKLIDFVSMYKHDKKYLICDNYESAETMLKHEDAYINNLERISILDLAKSIVIEYYAKNNKIKEINIISNEYKTILMSNILSENKSFIPSEAISDATVNELIRVMNIIRSAHEPTNKANERIKDIKLLINLYENTLKEKELGLLESEKVVDEYLNKAKDILDIKYEVSACMFSEEQIYCFSAMIIYIE